MKRKTILPALFGTLILLLLLPGCVSRETLATRKLRIENIDVSTIPDGTYVGKYIYSELEYTAVVRVRDGKITSIQIDENKKSPRIDWAMPIVDRVIAANSTQVEVISGATTSSKALLKAIELALKAGLKQQ